MDLVIMAAGMGSRFGGLKQLEPIDDNGNFIIDYSIYDAVKFGFDRVVFIIKEENYDIFKETVGKRVEKRIATEYVFQKMDDIPDGFSVPAERVKPWGTAHAIYATRNVVKGDFAIINADDFYGADAFRVVAEFLKNSSNKNEYALVGYQAINTITDNGSVKRGVADIKDGKLTNLIESSIEKISDTKLHATPLDGRAGFDIEPTQPVSMNMFGLKQIVFDRLERDFPKFLSQFGGELKSEFLIPDVIADQIKDGEVEVKVLNTTAVWQGVTYKEDKPRVVAEIKKLVQSGCYPEKLWN